MADPIKYTLTLEMNGVVIGKLTRDSEDTDTSPAFGHFPVEVTNWLYYVAHSPPEMNLAPIVEQAQRKDS